MNKIYFTHRISHQDYFCNAIVNIKQISEAKNIFCRFLQLPKADADISSLSIYLMKQRYFVLSKNNDNTISIKLNAITNYIGQFYALGVAVIITPFYLQYLGAEAYGVVGFFIVMQNWLNLLDMGLSTTLVRQVAYARGKVNGFSKFHHLLRSFEF